MGHEVFSAGCQHHLVMLEGKHQHHSEQPVVAESLIVDPSLVPDIFGEGTFSLTA